MKEYSATLANGDVVRYVDRKRWFWLMSVFFPLQPLISLWLHAKTGSEAWLFFGFLTFYVVAPAIDLGLHAVWVDEAGDGLPVDAPVEPHRIIRAITELI